MGPYYDHASLQMRAFARQRLDRALTPPAKGLARSALGDDGEGRQSLAVRALALPGVALAFSVAGLLSKLVAGDVWTMLVWRALFSASIVVLAAALSSALAAGRRLSRRGAAPSAGTSSTRAIALGSHS